MKYFVHAKPGAKQNRVEQMDDTHFRIWVKSLARDGKANEHVLEVLGSFLGRSKTSLQILSGHQSKNKVVGTK